MSARLRRCSQSGRPSFAVFARGEVPQRRKSHKQAWHQSTLETLVAGTELEGVNRISWPSVS